MTCSCNISLPLARGRGKGNSCPHIMRPSFQAHGAYMVHGTRQKCHCVQNRCPCQLALASVAILSAAMSLEPQRSRPQHSFFLRTGEALSLHVGHVNFSRYAAQGVLLLPWTKSGQRAGAPGSVPFDDAVVTKLFHIACHGRAATDFVFAGSGSRFRALFEEALQALGLSHMVLDLTHCAGAAPRQTLLSMAVPPARS